MNPNCFAFALRHLLAVCICLAASTRVSTQPSSDYVETGNVARAFTLKNRKTGEPIQLSDYAGKIVVLDLFAYW